MAQPVDLGRQEIRLPFAASRIRGSVNLIYIDPPFETVAFFFPSDVPDVRRRLATNTFTFTKEPSMIEHKAYRDTWGRGLNSYIQWFYETAIFFMSDFTKTEVFTFTSIGKSVVPLDWSWMRCLAQRNS